MGLDSAYGIGSLKQGVCTSTTRPASPFEGQQIYETDTDLTYVYSGSAWQQFAGGTAVGNSGLVYIASGTTTGTTNTLSIPTSFTSTYEHYLLQLTVGRTTLTTDAVLQCQLYASASVVNAGSSYAYASDQRYTTTQSNSGTNAESEIPLGRYSDKESVFNITFNSPQNAAIATQIQSFNTNVQTGFTVDANRCVGIRRAEETNEGVFFWSSVNFISSWVLYGYRK